MAELVADALREQILGGRFNDGDRLPKQESLAESFDISGPSVREGLRILEAEGLITVRRGKFGGAFVHNPKPGNAAYMLALVLEAKRAPLHEIGSALRDMEPLCAGRCAARADRATAVLPRLQQLHDEMCANIGENYRDNIKLGLEFHEALVECCGSETLITMIGALESIWFAHAEQLLSADPFAREVAPGSAYADVGLSEHAEMIDRITAGDVDGATAVSRKHLEHSRLHMAGDGDGDMPIQASLLSSFRPD